MNLTDDEIRVKCAEAMGKHQYFGVLYSGSICSACGGHIEDSSHDIPNYPASVDAALTLCDRLRSEGWSENHYRTPGGVWSVEISRDPFFENPEIIVSDPSLARAICLAFLRVKGEVKQ